MGKAKELEKTYDWMGSVDYYRTALNMIPEQDKLGAAEIRELIGYGFFRAACQADSVEEFKKRMRLSVESYERAAELFETVDSPSSLYCRAMAKHSNAWLVENLPQKKQLLDDCWRLLKEAFEGFGRSKNYKAYGKVFRGSEGCLQFKFGFVEDWREGKQLVEEILKYGADAVLRLSEIGDAEGLSWAYLMMSLFMVGNLDYFEEKKEEVMSKISDYVEKASSLSEKTDDLYFHALLDWANVNISLWVKGNAQAAEKYAEKLLQYAEKLKDHYTLGYAYFGLNFTINFIETTEEDPDKRKEKINSAMRYAEESIRQGLLARRYDYVSYSYAFFLIDYHHELAELETELEGKRALLKRAVDVGRKGSEYAQLSGSPLAISYVIHPLSKALFFLSETETNIGEKKRLLQESLELREKTLKDFRRLTPHDSWDYGLMHNYLALIKASLATIERDNEEKRHLLESAVSEMEECLQICTKAVQRDPAAMPRTFAVLGWYHDWFGEILDQLYLLTNDETIISKAVEVNQNAAQVYQKAGMSSRVAEAYWKVARLYDRQGEYAKAADNFELAAKNYQLVAEKIPQFQRFYQDHKAYMRAWSDFEKAKLAHQKEEYEKAKSHYENAADELKSAERWRYLVPNFSAWATLEEAEDLSKKEKNEESKQAFQRAAQQFCNAKATMDDEAKRTENPDEKAQTRELSLASECRSEYSLARAELEEAKTDAKNEDHASSTKEYGAVAEKFERIAQKLERESDRSELLFQASMCRALEKMELAEEKSEPDLYAEASELFAKTQKLTITKRNALLALGNSCFCKALESGTKFKTTPNSELYISAKQYMERAAHHYTEAGFETAAKWTKATQRLFDAYFYMCNAEAEVDPEKKAKHYQLAEKHLDLAARLYETAGYISKRDETLKHLERVREEKELLISPAEILKAPSVISATPTISAPTPTSEEAVGIEGFEHANIQANLIIRLREVKVGENLDLEIEMVNAGKCPALLIKTEHIIPEGFEVKEKPEIYRVEDSYLNMKGKRLEPLKTEEVKLVLRPLNKGTFDLRPRILYLDENGKYKSYETEPVTVKVKELGVSGWLKGA
jgi:hypothetical protein